MLKILNNMGRKKKTLHPLLLSYHLHFSFSYYSLFTISELCISVSELCAIITRQGGAITTGNGLCVATGS